MTFELERDNNGDVKLYCVWALRPGQPQIVAICSSEAVAERYRPAVHQNFAGAVCHIEVAILDHAFGRRDIQSMIYRAATRARATPADNRAREGE